MLNDIKEWETCESHGPSGRPKKQATGRRTTAEVNHSSCQVTRSLYFTEVAIPQDKPIRHSFTEQTDPSSFHYLLSGREVSNRQIAVAGTGLTPFLKPSRPSCAPVPSQLRVQLTVPRATHKLKTPQLFIGNKPPRATIPRHSSFYRRRRMSGRLSLDSYPRGSRLLSCMRLDPVN